MDREYVFREVLEKTLHLRITSHLHQLHDFIVENNPNAHEFRLGGMMGSGFKIWKRRVYNKAFPQGATILQFNTYAEDETEDRLKTIASLNEWFADINLDVIPSHPLETNLAESKDIIRDLQEALKEARQGTTSF